MSDPRFPCGYIPSRWRKVMLLIVTAFTLMLCIQEINRYFNQSQTQDILSGNFLTEETELSNFFEKYNRKEEKKENNVKGEEYTTQGETKNTMQGETKNTMQGKDKNINDKQDKNQNINGVQRETTNNMQEKKNKTFKQDTNSNEMADVHDVLFRGKLIALYLIQHDVNNMDDVLSCGPYECTFTADSSRLKEADAVVVDGLLLSLTKKRITPERTSPDQVWVYYSQDPWSAYGSQFPYGKWNSIFNWTFTYHKDSTIMVPGGEVVRNKENYHASLMDTMKKKTKKVLWIVNECRTDSRREDYVNELKKFIDVDIMGECGDSRCSDDDDHTSCYDEYMFYLSFESTLCKDYVTDNFFKTFDHPIVPVVRGGANYSALYQKDLYINTADFASPRHLAHYLKYLIKNTTAYVEYLKRRANFSVVYRGNSHCLLCSYLYHLIVRRRSYPNLAAWLGRCQSPTDLNF